MADLVRVISELHLPVDARDECAVLEAVHAYLDECEISVPDGAILLAEANRRLSCDGCVETILLDVVDIVLGVALNGSSGLSGKNYFAIYERLTTPTTDWAALSDVTARRLLSRAALIEHLLRQLQMSCSQVARVLRSVDSSLDVPYQAVARVASTFGVRPRFDGVSAENQLWSADAGRATELFPDTDLRETCLIAEREMAILVPDVDLASTLETLARIESTPFWPYLQILHFCCMPIEFYDHPPQYLYEFAPRGNTAEALFDRYPAATGNPVLNNAKAVQSLDGAWARNRGGDDAHALVRVLELLDSLPYAARFQVARIVRAWLVRVLELTDHTVHAVPEDLSIDEFWRIAEWSGRNESRTRGVLEQRIVDALSAMTFGRNGWRPTGLGDSVNASNLSGRKLGDIEFANVDLRTAIAVEAHGGQLTAAYVREHRRSLARVLQLRLRESWLLLDEASKWSVRVIFVAHSRDDGLPSRETVHGVEVTYEYWTYEELIASARGASASAIQILLFRRHILDRVNLSTVRQEVRDLILEIARPTRA